MARRYDPTTGLIERRGGASVAPVAASYVTVGANATLSAERTLAVGSALTLTDGGANSTITVSLDADLVAIAALASTGLLAHTGAGTWAERTLAAPAAGLTISNPAGVAGNPTFALANDLAALEGLGSTGLAARTAADTWAQRTLQAPAAGFTITNPAGVSGDPTFVLANDLSALEGLAATGIACRTAADTWAQRTITGGTGVTITNPGGVAGNIDVSLALGSIDHNSLLNLATGDVHTHYTLKAGRTGTTNDTTLSTSADGTLSGSSNNGSSLILNSSSGDHKGAISVDPGTYSLTAGKQGFIFNPTLDLSSAAAVGGFVFGANASFSRATWTVSSALVSAFGGGGTVFAMYPRIVGNNISDLGAWAIFDNEIALRATGGTSTCPRVRTLVQAPVLDVTGGGTLVLTEDTGLYSLPTIGASCTITTRAAVKVKDKSGSGDQAACYGLDMDDQTMKATTGVAAVVRSALTPGAGGIVKRFLYDTGGAQSDLAGKFTTYNAVATVADGIPYEVATYDGTGLTANDNAGAARTIHTTGATGYYRVSVYTTITTVGSVSSTRPSVTVGWTDGDSNTAMTGVAAIATSTTNTLAGASGQATAVLYCRTGTAITTTSAGYASSAAGMAYSLHVRVERLG